MIINTTPNLQYSDRIGHKSKSRVTEDRVSINKYFNETPLKRDSKDISFKGVSSLQKALGFYNKKNFRLKENLELLEKSLGNTPKRIYEQFKTPEWADIQKNIKELENGEVQVRTKNWTKLLLEGIVYPITELPLHIYKGTKELITGKKLPIYLKDGATDNRTFLQKKLDILNNSDIINSFNGMMETANKLKYDSKNVQSASLFTKAMKQFDPKAGNYNGVHERALTRIVTGIIPAFFLANDAYNLSRLCDDDPQKAKVEHDTRFNQEIKRVVSNAYLQLITLGALSKYINSNKIIYMLVTAATVIMTEAYSRLSNGKSIVFINKKQAIEMNKKNAQKSGQTTETKEEKQVQATKDVEKANLLNFKGSSPFQGFGIAADMPLTTNTPSVRPASAKTENKNDKPLISPEGIAKWFATMIIAGFAIKYAKKNVKINGQKLKDYFEIVSKKYDNFYDKITMKDYIVSKNEFNKVIDKLTKYNKTLGLKFKQVATKHQFASAIQDNAAAIYQELKNEGFTELAQEFTHLANKDKNKRFADIAVNKEATEFFKNKQKELIDANLKKFFKLLDKAGLQEKSQKIKDALYEQNALNLKNYQKAKNLIDKDSELKTYSVAFDNKFKVDEESETIKTYVKALSALKSKNSKAVDKLKQIRTNAINCEEYNLGKRKRPLIREVADFITQPFKFIWGTITLPYKHIANRIYNLATKAEPPKWEKELDAVSNAVRKLTYKNKYMPWTKARIDIADEEFVSYMDKRINKAFNDRTMSSVSNADLSALAKNTTTVATSWFLLCDNHNMVMLKSNGEDKEGAVMKAKERAIQETSRTFWNLLFINLFNDTFRHTFNSSLLGAEVVNTASTYVGENVNRLFIGMPVTKKSKDEILTQESENISNQGIKGDFFRFMTRLTGKKVLSQREQTQKK